MRSAGPGGGDERDVGVRSTAVVVSIMGLAVPPTDGAAAGHASTAEARETTGDETPASWYGYQTLLGDAAAALSFVAGVASQRLELVVTGFVTYTGAAPVIHCLHDETLRGMISLTLRLLLLYPVIVAANLCASDEPGYCGSFARGVAVIGMGFAAAVDAALIAWDPD